MKIQVVLELVKQELVIVVIENKGSYFQLLNYNFQCLKEAALGQVLSFGLNGTFYVIFLSKQPFHYNFFFFVV